MPTVLRVLPEQLRLQSEDVIEHPIDAPALEPVVGYHPRPLEMTPQRRTEGSVDASLPADLRLLQQLEAPVERYLPGPVGPDVHSVPSTSMRPSAVTRTCTGLSGGSA